MDGNSKTDGNVPSIAFASLELRVCVNDLAIVFDVDDHALKESRTAVSLIERRNGNFAKPEDKYLIPGKFNYPVVCIFGVINLLAGRYLVIATKSKVIDHLFNAPIHQIKEVKLVQVNRRELSSSGERDAEDKYIKSVETLLSDGSFYFSPNYDLTTNCQKKLQADERDQRFDWAVNMRESYLKSVKSESDELPFINYWCFPVIRGFISITNTFKVGSTVINYVLISRMSRERPGRRFIVRGANHQGKVVNYVETEQIIYSPLPQGYLGFPHPGTLSGSTVIDSLTVTSFVQVRGSIPVLWSQKPNLSWEPPIKIKATKDEDNLAVLRNHFDDQLHHYKNQTVVSLIKLKGGESKLGTEYTKHINNTPTINDSLNYVQFDLHAEVGLTRYKNLQKLFNETDKKLQSYGFFSITKNGTEVDVKLQEGTMRTNCKDNLDRTNLVQGRFALKAVTEQLEFFIPGLKTTLSEEQLSSIERLVRVVWADNGDSISIQYAGTPAMRSDHTRTGKTTLRGQFNDAVGAVTRYYINNFEDGKNQDAIDLVIGRGIPEPPNKKAHITTHKKQNIITSFLTRLFTFIFKLIQPTRTNNLSLFLCFIWMSWVFVIWKLLRLDPNRILDQPKLKKKKETDLLPPNPSLNKSITTPSSHIPTTPPTDVTVTKKEI